MKPAAAEKPVISSSFAIDHVFLFVAMQTGDFCPGRRGTAAGKLLLQLSLSNRSGNERCVTGIPGFDVLAVFIRRTGRSVQITSYSEGQVAALKLLEEPHDLQQ